MTYTRDPSTVGPARYERHALNFYPTPRRALESGLQALPGVLPGFELASADVWEPFCGNGAISNVLAGRVRRLVSTDLCAYEGFDPDGLLDFREATLDKVAAIGGFLPDLIFSNPPYGRHAEEMAVQAISLMEGRLGAVAFLCRQEWDASARRSGLFDHPAFRAKITLRHRPRWIEGSKGAPRFPYAWFVWSWGETLGDPPILAYAP